MGNLIQTKKDFKSLQPGVWIENNLIDLWVEMLNMQEKLKADSTPLRLFIPSELMVSMQPFDTYISCL